jgi:hypothetical protein
MILPPIVTLFRRARFMATATAPVPAEPDPRPARATRPELNEPEKPNPRSMFMSLEELIAWAWQNRRDDILAQLGIFREP